MENYTNKIKPDFSLLQAGMHIGSDETFLKKYSDEDGIFITDEGAKLLKKELSVFAAKDGNKAELSEEEAVDFYNKLMSDNDKNFEKVESFEKGKNPVFKWLNGLVRQKYIQNEITKDTGRNYSFEEFGTLAHITDEELALAKELFKADLREIYTPLDISTIIHDDTGEKNLSRIKELMNLGDDFHSISAFYIADISSLDDEQYERAKELFNLKLSDKNLYMMAQLDREEIDKILQKNPNVNIDAINSEYIEIENPFETQTDTEGSYLIFSTKTGKIAETVNVLIDSDNHLLTKVIENKANHIRHTIKRDIQTTRTEEELIERFDSNGNLISTEKMIHENGGRKVSLTDKDGKQSPVQWSTNDKESGCIILQRDLISPDGTRTNYYYEESPEGIKINEYKITDKDGNVLLNQRRTFMPVEGNPDKFISSVNDRIYEIEYSGNTVQITDKKENNVTTFDLSKLTDTPSKDIITALKRLPGDALIDIKERKLKKIGIDDMVPSWDKDNKVLYMHSSEYSDETEQFGVFMHEFGHFLDTEIDSEKFGEISQNPEFLKVYKKELENFKHSSTSLMQEYVDYFIDHEGDDIGAQAETVAESHKILTSPHTETRTYYLQQNFPETIAKIAELLEKQQNN